MTAPSPLDLLIIGGSGFVGGRTAQAAQSAGLTVACTHLARPAPPGIPAIRLDVTDSAALAACLSAHRPRALVYCAVSYAPTDDESMSEAAQMRVSAGGVEAIVQALRRAGAPTRLVYVSTNGVFSGNSGPYKETDLPDPEARFDRYRFYGLGRRAGEQIALNEWPESIVARTSHVDGLDAWGRLNPRLQTTIDQLSAGQVLPRFIDRTISPTLLDSLAGALVEIAQPDFEIPGGLPGILHLAGSEPVTDFDFTLRLARKLALPETLVQPGHYLAPGSPGRYNIALDVTFTQPLLRTLLPDIDTMLSRICGSILP